MVPRGYDTPSPLPAFRHHPFVARCKQRRALGVFARRCNRHAALARLTHSSALGATCARASARRCSTPHKLHPQLVIVALAELRFGLRSPLDVPRNLPQGLSDSLGLVDLRPGRGVGDAFPDVLLLLPCRRSPASSSQSPWSIIPRPSYLEALPAVSTEFQDVVVAPRLLWEYPSCPRSFACSRPPN